MPETNHGSVMKECRDIRELLSALLDNAVTAVERQRVETHLAACPRCREALAGLERTVALLRNQGEVEPPPWLASRIMARIADEPAAHRSFWQRLFQPWPVKMPLQVMALLVLCVTGYMMSRENITNVNLPAPSGEQAPPRPAASAPVTESAPAVVVPKSGEEPRPAPAAPSVMPQRLPGPASAPVSPGQMSQSAADSVPAPPAAGRSKVDGVPQFRETLSAPAAAGKDVRAPAAERVQDMNAQPQSLMTQPPAKMKRSDAKEEASGSLSATAPVTLRLTPVDPAAAGPAIADLARQLGGNIQASSTRSITMQIPVARYPDLLRGLGRLGTLPDGQEVPLPGTRYQQVVVIW